MKVLVAEDDLASGKFMQKLLSKYGEVVLARDESRPWMNL